MEVKIKNEDLMKALQNVGSVISTKTIEPILQNVLLKIEDGTPYLVGTNLEQGMKVKLNAEVKDAEEVSEVVLQYALLKNVVSKFKKDKETIIDINSKTSSVKQGSSVYKINNLDASAFALLPDVEEKVKFEIKLDTLRNLIDETLFAVSKKEESRKEFRGVFFEVTDGKIRFVGTDGTVLAKSEMPMQNLPEISFIIPWKATEILQKANLDSESVLVLSDNTQIAFVTPDITIVSLLINGTYPPYEQVIPKESEFTAETNKEELLEALNRLETIANRGTGKVALLFSENTITASAKSPEMGEGKEKLHFEGNAEVEVVFSSSKLIEGISHIKADTVKFFMNGPLHPVKIIGQGDDSFVYVIMPQRP